jgi:hypothetical protein
MALRSAPQAALAGMVVYTAQLRTHSLCVLHSCACVYMVSGRWCYPCIPVSIGCVVSTIPYCQ